ncbi:type IV toxin-antitoxin system AbiEi family antitoxin domain-containing protein [bacterium]|nr:type IV toxin-antitoxin system AbiEi family antitoxin domain-containing protein [bacterium]
MRNSTRAKLTRAARRHSGIFTAKDIIQEGLSIKTLYNLRDSGEIICISRGLYQLAYTNDTEIATPDYAAIRKRVPNGVICLISALYHHKLTTEIPHKIYLAIDRNAHIPRIDYPPTSIFRMSSKPFSAGVENMVIGSVEMRIYSVEKSIADCFKYRNKLGLDLAIESLKNYFSNKNASVSTLLKMSRICRIETVINPYLEALI